MEPLVPWRRDSRPVTWAAPVGRIVGRGEVRATATLGAGVIVLIGVDAALTATHPPSVPEIGTADLGFVVSFASLSLAGVLTVLAQPGIRMGPLLVLAGLAFVLSVTAETYALHRRLGSGGGGLRMRTHHHGVLCLRRHDRALEADRRSVGDAVPGCVGSGQKGP